MLILILSLDILVVLIYYGVIFRYFSKRKIHLEQSEFLTAIPKDLSPGAAHMMLHSVRYLKTIAIVLVSLAEKGFISIVDDSGDFIFIREKSLDDTAFDDEKGVYNVLFDGGDERYLDYYSYSLVSRLRGVISQSFLTVFEDRFYQKKKSFLFGHVFVSVAAVFLSLFVPTSLGFAPQTNAVIAVTLLVVILFVIVPFSNEDRSKEGRLILQLLQKIEDFDEHNTYNSVVWSMVFGKEKEYYDVSASEEFSWFKTQFSNEKHIVRPYSGEDIITPTITVINEMSHEKDVEKQNIHFVPWLSKQLEDVLRNAFNNKRTRY